jgi:hypothetical protein
MGESIEGIWTIQRIVEPLFAHAITLINVSSSLRN